MSMFDYMIARFTGFFNNVETYIANHRAAIQANLISLDRWIGRISRRLARLMFTGLILLFVAYFVPLERDFPILYQFAHGLVTLLEFMIRIVLGFFYNLFTGNLSTWWNTYTHAFDNLTSQFGNWLATL